MWAPRAYLVLTVCDIVPLLQIGKQRLTGNMPKVTGLQSDGTGFNLAPLYHTTCHPFKHQYLYFLQFLRLFLSGIHAYFFWQCYYCYYYHLFLIIYGMLKMHHAKCFVNSHVYDIILRRTPDAQLLLSPFNQRGNLRFWDAFPESLDKWQSW